MPGWLTRENARNGRVGVRRAVVMTLAIAAGFHAACGGGGSTRRPGVPAGGWTEATRGTLLCPGSKLATTGPGLRAGEVLHDRAWGLAEEGDLVFDLGTLLPSALSGGQQPLALASIAWDEDAVSELVLVYAEEVSASDEDDQSGSGEPSDSTLVQMVVLDCVDGEYRAVGEPVGVAADADVTVVGIEPTVLPDRTLGHSVRLAISRVGGDWNDTLFLLAPSWAPPPWIQGIGQATVWEDGSLLLTLPLSASGWYPRDEEQVFVTLAAYPLVPIEYRESEEGVSSELDDGASMPFEIAPYVLAVLTGRELVGAGSMRMWLALGRGEMPSWCRPGPAQTSVRCEQLDPAEVMDLTGGDAPVNWVAGGWSSPHLAAGDLLRLGTDPTRVEWLYVGDERMILDASGTLGGPMGPNGRPAWLLIPVRYPSR